MRKPINDKSQDARGELQREISPWKPFHSIKLLNGKPHPVTHPHPPPEWNRSRMDLLQIYNFYTFCEV